MHAHITARDIAILLDLYHYRYLSFLQLVRLHFPSRDSAYQRLRILKREGLVKTFNAPAIADRIFHLDSEGAKLVAAELDSEVEDLSWYRYSKTPKDYYYLRHFLAINDFRILLTQACVETPITLLGFIPEYIGEKTKQGHVRSIYVVASKSIRIRRMGYLHLKKTEIRRFFFLKLTGDWKQ